MNVRVRECVYVCVGGEGKNEKKTTIFQLMISKGVGKVGNRSGLKGDESGLVSEWENARRRWRKGVCL